MNQDHYPTDYFGNRITDGDIVAYPVRFGSSMTMHHGKVLYVTRCKSMERYRSLPGNQDLPPRFKLRIRIIGFGSSYRLETDKKSPEATIECLNRSINLSAVKRGYVELGE